MVNRPPDPRLREVQALLEDLVAKPVGDQTAGASHWELPVLPPPDPDGRLSSTDLLSWWFRAPQQGADPWGDFFDQPSKSPSTTSDLPALDTLQARNPVAEPTEREPPIESPATLAFFPEPEEQLAEEHAQAAVDCLYDFLHAIGRRDIDAALAHIAEDYHGIENDREVDRLTLRHKLKSHLDSLVGWEIEASLAQAPEPLSHPYGILIAVEIQMDAFHPETGEKRCQVEPRVAVLDQDTGGTWRIRALSLIER